MESSPPQLSQKFFELSYIFHEPQISERPSCRPYRKRLHQSSRLKLCPKEPAMLTIERTQPKTPTLNFFVDSSETIHSRKQPQCPLYGLYKAKISLKKATPLEQKQLIRSRIVEGYQLVSLKMGKNNLMSNLKEEPSAISVAGTSGKIKRGSSLRQKYQTIGTARSSPRKKLFPASNLQQRSQPNYTQDSSPLKGCRPWSPSHRDEKYTLDVFDTHM